jgi:hypothetical protein
LHRNFRQNQQCLKEEGIVPAAPRASSAVHPRRLLATLLVAAIAVTTGEEVIEAVMAAAVVVVVVVAAAAAAASFTSAVSASTPAKNLWSRFSPSSYVDTFGTLPPPFFTNLCCRYGRVADAFVPSDRENPGRNRGFGFVTFDDAASAQVTQFADVFSTGVWSSIFDSVFFFYFLNARSGCDGRRQRHGRRRPHHSRCLRV